MTPGQIGFAFLCIIGIVAILAAAGLEIIRFRRGDSLLGLRQYRLRLVSSVIWTAVLFINLYAVTVLWPAGGTSPAAKAEARQFLAVILSGCSLLLVALVLLMVDLLHTSRERRAQEARFQADLIGRAREEALRLKQAKPTQNT